MDDINKRLQAVALKHETTVKQLLEDHGIESYDGDDDYTEWLDETGVVDVAGLKYSPSYILFNLDPIAYRCGYSDFIDYQSDYDIIIYIDSAMDYYKTEDIEELIDQLETTTENEDETMA